MPTRHFGLYKHGRITLQLPTISQEDVPVEKDNREEFLIWMAEFLIWMAECILYLMVVINVFKHKILKSSLVEWKPPNFM